MSPSSRSLAVAFSLLVASEHAAAEELAVRAASTRAVAPSGEAQRRYERGVRAYADGHYRDAIDLFRDADRMAPSAALSFDIARAYAALGDDAGALGAYREYLRRAENSDDAEEVQRTVKKLSQRLASHGVQQVTVLSVPPGATVFLDGERFGVTPATFETKPGVHTLTVHLEGYADENRQLPVPSKEAIDVRVTLEPQAPAVSPAPAPMPAAAVPPLTPSERAEPSRKAPLDEEPDPSTSGQPFRTMGIVAIGAGGAALGGALAFELLRRSAEEKAKSEQEQVALAKELDTIHSRRTAARVLAGVGAGLTVIGGTLFFVRPSSSPSGKDRGTAVKLDVTGTDLRAVVSGRF